MSLHNACFGALGYMARALVQANARRTAVIQSCLETLDTEESPVYTSTRGSVYMYSYPHVMEAV